MRWPDTSKARSNVDTAVTRCDGVRTSAFLARAMWLSGPRWLDEAVQSVASATVSVAVTLPRMRMLVVVLVVLVVDVVSGVAVHASRNNGPTTRIRKAERGEKETAKSRR